MNGAVHPKKCHSAQNLRSSHFFLFLLSILFFWRGGRKKSLFFFSCADVFFSDLPSLLVHSWEDCGWVHNVVADHLLVPIWMLGII
jgi:hypothetical protein